MWSTSWVRGRDLVGDLVLQLVLLVVVEVELLAELLHEVLVVDLVLQVPVDPVFDRQVSRDGDVELRSARPTFRLSIFFSPKSLWTFRRGV